MPERKPKLVEVKRRGVFKGSKLGPKRSKERTGLLKVIKVPAGGGTTEAYQVTEDAREKVKTMIVLGIPHERIAQILGCSYPTMVKHFHRELEMGKDLRNTEVANSLYYQATHGNVSAQIFWLKCRARWRENDPLPFQPPNVQYDPKKLPLEERLLLQQLLAKMKVTDVVDVAPEGEDA